MASTELTYQQEKFVLALFLGMCQRQAFYEAYPTSKTWKVTVTDVKASALANNGKVMVRLQELRDEVVNDVKYTREWLLKGFEEIFNKCFVNIPVYGADGEPT